MRKSRHLKQMIKVGKRKRQGVFTFCAEKRQKPVIPACGKSNGTVLFTGKCLGKKRKTFRGIPFFAVLPGKALRVPFPPAFHHAVNSSRSRLSTKGLLAVGKAAINPRAYNWGRGVDAIPPVRIFLNFSKTNYYLDLPFSVVSAYPLHTF